MNTSTSKPFDEDEYVLFPAGRVDRILDSIQAQAEELVRIRSETAAADEALILAGTLLSNAAFNLSQKDVRLTETDRTSLRRSYERWDEAVLNHRRVRSAK